MRKKFQPTLPQGERPVKLADDLRKADISTHAPARGATPFYSHSVPNNRNFNPRSRKGSDQIGAVYLMHLMISTHAPARGATDSNGD